QRQSTRRQFVQELLRAGDARQHLRFECAHVVGSGFSCRCHCNHRASEAERLKINHLASSAAAAGCAGLLAITNSGRRRFLQATESKQLFVLASANRQAMH
ncbi:MAG: hypothetical protein AB7F95_19365, partial [Burkholderiales bacterium]